MLEMLAEGLEMYTCPGNIQGFRASSSEEPIWVWLKHEGKPTLPLASPPDKLTVYSSWLERFNVFIIEVDFQPIFYFSHVSSQSFTQ